MSPTKAPARPAVRVPAAAGLKAAAQWAVRAVNPNPTVPILGAFVVDAADGLLSLSAFDFESYVSVGVPVAGGFDDRLYVPAKLLADAIGRLSGDVTLELDDRDLVVSSGGTAFRLRTMLGDTYPPVPEAAAPTGKVDAARFADAVHAAAVCASRDFLKQVPLTRMHLTATDGVLTVWATDRYRVAQITTGWDGADFDAIVPAVALTAALKGLDGTLAVGVDDNKVTLDGGGRIVTILKAAGEYPALDQLWTPRGQFAHIDRAQLDDAIKAARMTVLDEQGVNLHVNAPEGVAEVTGMSERASNRALTDAAGDMQNDFTFNPAFLADIVAAVPGPRVHLAAAPDNHPFKPVEIRGADDNGDPIDGASYVLVPIRRNR